MEKSLRLPRLLLVYLLYLLSLLFMLHLASLPLTAAQAYMNMTRGTSLYSSGPNSSLTSRSGDFTFGFRAYNSDESLFLLAIWFNATSPQHIIWFAMDGENPILAPKDSKLQFDHYGLLALISSDGSQLWSSQRESNLATLLDSGNFVICKFVCDAHNPPLWESFNHPTDTLVPGQNLSYTQELWSKLTDSNFSQGRFTLVAQIDDNIVLYPVNPLVSTRYLYNASWEPSSYCKQLMFHPNGSLICLLNPWVNITSSPILSPHNYYQHATLDPDGFFRMYAYLKRNNTVGWEVTGINDPRGCSLRVAGGGICGINGLCNMSSMNQTRLQCSCPRNYSLIDQDNIYMGCKPDQDVRQYCGAVYKPTDFKFIELNHTDWPSQDYESYGSLGEDKCKDICLQDCNCVVAIYRPNSCKKKTLPLLDGIYSESDTVKAFIKVPQSQPDLPPNDWQSNHKNTGRNPLIIGGATLLGVASILLVVVALLAVHLMHTFKKSRMDLTMSWKNLKEFTYKELQRATKSFQEELGRGAYGVVYKGILPSDPPTVIAVKRLALLNNGQREFESEVHSIGQSHHKNLVKLIGFCNEGSNRMLVYEFMSNGSLEHFIEVGAERLNWDKRAKVALGIAKGLQYLHEDCNPPVIHCDIKPPNILLDDKFVAKISDFGVAKLLGADQTHTSTLVRVGTKGYMAPEMTSSEQITSKVDVYSFGVVLLEIIFCRVGIAQQAMKDLWADKMNQVLERFKEQLLEDMGDVEDEANIQSMQKFVEVAIACLQVDPCVRPTMRDVAYFLARAIPTPEPTDAVLIPAPTDTIPISEPTDAVLTPQPIDNTTFSPDQKPMLYQYLRS
ncbi:Serine/threonine-protein kinase [Rhynchospora pubera]|uniref:Receptor-like serine/threonine-protein kinase n=1 Tax=Rhynchospora pubera TaxID=906938 RepID=A0AAV8CGD0_9POAL|nr:Serine/threonine-protein kinase [Rhynchospora pubera]